MTKAEFEKLVVAAVGKLPERIRTKIKNVEFFVEESYGRQSADGREDHLFGLYEGVPRTERGESYFGVLPDRITIFKPPIEEECAGDPMKIKCLVEEVVFHEVGHYFGFDEEEIRRLEEERFS